ncbi:MAG: hypothetical protein LBQ69_00715 [Treponema sp.]|jgi:class 3 adenylate cyclase|nr:hypothetical protein [Treponema sp.]
MKDTLISELDSVEKKSIGLVLDIGAIEGLKKMPIDVFDGVYLGEAHDNALVLCVDVRNFSDFLCSHAEDTVFKLLKEFTANLLSCINQFGYGCSYYKLMGDGALIIWDETSENSINEALFIFSTYVDFLEEDLFKPFDKLSLAGALVTGKVFKYEISAELSELKYRDYVGYGINLASRLQTLAGGNELVVNKTLAESGVVPFRVNQSPKIQKDLLLLKGLMDEDRKQVLFYDGKPSISTMVSA